MVNFQKMEAMLKFLGTQQAMSGSLEDLPKVLARAKKSMARQPMGQLAEAFIQSAYSNPQTTAGPRETREIAVSFSFRMELAPESMRERKKTFT